MSLKKVERLKEQFALQMQCAKNAGIYDYCFLAFGSLLGYVRERGFIGHDNDMDIAFLGDEITVKQIRAYIQELKRPTIIDKKLKKRLLDRNSPYLNDRAKPRHPRGLYGYREDEKVNRYTGKLFWTTLRMHPKSAAYKCCNWFFFNHKGYSYHHKGGESKIKGLPMGYVNEIGPEVEYLGTKVHIPKHTGACLDFWYPDWDTPRSNVTKSEGQLLKVERWDNPNKWKMMDIG